MAANAIPVSRQQGPGKTIEVTCPMCETKGFISSKAAGKQVKCCNPQCMVPLFTAPALEKKEVVAPPRPPKKKIPWLYIGGGIAFAAIAGASIYFMQDHGPTELPPLAPYTGSSSSGSDPLSMTEDKKDTQTQIDVKPEIEQGPNAARDAVIKQALARMFEVYGNVRRERQPMWRRLAVTAFTYAGDPKKAREQLDLLEKTSNQSSWEGIPPLVDMAWRSAKFPEEFQKTIDEAARLAEKLPVRGRFATESAIAIAPLLVVSGKAEAARQLLAKHHSESPLEQLAGATRIVIADNSFNFDRPFTGRTFGDWQFPLETSVTLALAVRGRWDDAHSWASQTADPVAKAEATTAWAETFLRDGVPVDDANGLAQAVAAGKGLSAEGKARLLARLADVRFGQNDRSGAAELLKQAQDALHSLSPPKPVIVEGAKPLMDMKLDDATTLKQMAFAAAEVAGVQARSGDPRAKDNIHLALRFLSGIGPAKSPTEERRRQVENDSNRVKTELKRSMALKGDDDIRRALTQYKLKLRDVEEAAASRFKTEIAILQAAVHFGLVDEVWDVLETYDHKPQKEHQPLIATFLPLLVAHQYAERGDKAKRDEIISATESRIDATDPEVVKLMAESDFKAGDLAGCSARLNAAITPHGHLHELVLRLASRLVVSGKVAEAIVFCNRLDDLTLREESLYLIAAQTARLGKGVEFWKRAKDQNLGAMESSAVAAGVVVGFKTEAAQ